MTNRTALIPAHLLFWARLPKEYRKKGHQAQEHRFERVLPVPVESVHIARAELSSGEVVLVGADLNRLRSHLAQLPDCTPDTWELVPDAVPAHLAEDGLVEAVRDRLNLLHGPLEPAPRRRLRRIQQIVMHVGLSLASLGALACIEYRRSTAERHAKHITATIQSEIDRALPAAGTNNARPEARLTMELRALEQASRGHVSGPEIDVGVALSRMWGNWPKDIRMQADVVTATSDRLIVRGRVPALADAERIAKACATVDVDGETYRCDPIQAQQTDQGALFTLTLTRPVARPDASGVR
jgi:hypothetical protein